MNPSLKHNWQPPQRLVRKASGGVATEFTEEWRCNDCGKLLGMANASQMQIRRKPLDYVVSLPVVATCYGCGALNVSNKP